MDYIFFTGATGGLGRECVKALSERGYTVFAGLTGFCSMVEGDCVELTERLLSVNVMGMVRVNRLFFDMVQTGPGRIINCSSD